MIHTPEGKTLDKIEACQLCCIIAGQGPNMWLGRNPLLSVHIKDSAELTLGKKNYSAIVPLWKTMNNLLQI